MSRAVRWIASFLVAALIGTGGGVMLSLTAPLPLGGRTFTVLSGSMEPAIAAGDIVVNERIRPMEARIGDIVTFRDPANPKRLITHRLRRVERSKDGVHMTTKGDANNSTESFVIAAESELGRVLFHVPHLGRVLAHTRAGIAQIVLVAVPATVLALLQLASIWRPKAKVRSDAAG